MRRVYTFIRKVRVRRRKENGSCGLFFNSILSKSAGFSFCCRNCSQGSHSTILFPLSVMKYFWFIILTLSILPTLRVGTSFKVSDKINSRYLLSNGLVWLSEIASARGLILCTDKQSAIKWCSYFMFMIDSK